MTMLRLSYCISYSPPVPAIVLNSRRFYITYDEKSYIIAIGLILMAGRRLIDAAKLFNASRSIVKQHINLRSQQLDVYSKTSILAKTVKNQTDRVTLTAKAAVAALTQAIAQETAEEEIWVNAVAPSVLDTPANRLAMPDADFGGWVQPSAAAEVIVFLASPDNRVTRGAVIPVYGGV